MSKNSSISNNSVKHKSYPSAEVQSLYSTAPADWASLEYDTKQSDGGTPVVLEFWEWGVLLHINCFQVHSDQEW